jgi:hypothetical protein
VLAHDPVSGDDQPMRGYRALITRPWAAAGSYALINVVSLTIAYDDDHGSGLSSFVIACLVTAVTVPFIWSGQRRRLRSTESVTGVLTAEQQESVYRSAATGVPTTDPTMRRASLDLARYQLAGAVRQRNGIIAAGLGGLALSVLFAVADAPSWHAWWWAFLGVVFVELLIEKATYPARQRRRIARLEHADGHLTSAAEPTVT